MELKANELKYGNTLLFLGDIVTFKNITEIREDGIFWIKTIEPKIESKNFHFKPISLTEEWLLKFGFKQEENPFWFCNNVISISPSTGTYVLYGKSGREITRTGLKYLHQLQNLHFALTNKELEIKM